MTLTRGTGRHRAVTGGLGIARALGAACLFALVLAAIIIEALLLFTAPFLGAVLYLLAGSGG